MAILDRTVFNTWVDDDGSNTVGTLIDKDEISDAILDPVDDELDRIDAIAAVLLYQVY